MTLSGIERLLLPIRRKLFLLIGRAILTAVNNDEKTQKIQVTLLKDENATDVERLQNYGFETYPVVGSSEAVILFINGNRDQGLTIIVHDRDNRPTDLNSGDVRVYDFRDNKITCNSNGIEIETGGTPPATIKLLNNGDIEIESGAASSATFKLTSSGNIEINGDADNAVSYTDLNTAMQTLVAAINTTFASKFDGVGAPGTLSLDLSSAKVDKVKLP